MKTISEIIEATTSLDTMVEDGLPSQVERYLSNLTEWELGEVKDFLIGNIKSERTEPIKKLLSVILSRGVFIQYLVSPKKYAFDIARAINVWKPAKTLLNIPEKIAFLKPYLEVEEKRNGLVLKQISDKNWELLFEGNLLMKSEGVSWNQLAGETLSEIFQPW